MWVTYIFGGSHVNFNQECVRTCVASISLSFFSSLLKWSSDTLRIRCVSVSDTRRNTYDYTKICHFHKLLFVSTCQYPCRVRSPCFMKSTSLSLVCQPPLYFHFFLFIKSHIYHLFLNLLLCISFFSSCLSLVSCWSTKKRERRRNKRNEIVNRNKKGYENFKERLTREQNKISNKYLV